MGTRRSRKSAVTMKSLGTIEIFVSREKAVSAGDRVTVRNISVVVVNHRSVIPVGPPVVPPPSVATEVPESKAYAKCNSRAVKVESRVGIPARPDCYRRHVDNIRLCRLNSYRLAVSDYRLLTGAIQVSGVLGSLTHHLNGTH